MRNRYMRRGVGLLLLGVALNILGWYIMDKEWEINGWKIKYGWAMVAGVILFGAGFLYVIYSLIRKVERQSILEERAIEQENITSEKSSPE